MTKLNEKALRGVDVINKILGPESGSQIKAFAESEKFGASLGQMALEFAYADAWNEGGLSRRERSLVLIGALVALRQPKELKNHVRLGFANGVLASELEQILIQLVPYVGFPAVSTAQEAMRACLPDQSTKPERSEKKSK